MKKKAICILNPFVSSKYLSSIFKEFNIKTISLLTDVDNAKLPRYDKDDFIEEIVLSSNIENDVKLLKKNIFDRYEVLLLINGLEDTVTYGDLLAFSLNLPHNDPKTSHLRYDKNAQIQALHDNQIPAPISKHINIQDLDKLDELTRDMELPLIIKPSVNGGSSIGVEICQTRDQLYSYFEAHKKDKNAFNHQITDFCIQEFLKGNEIVVDTVSYQRNHYLSSCWLQNKRYINGLPVYQTGICLPSTHEFIKTSFDYVKKVLDAIDHKNGIAHTEIMLTSTAPKLIEVNARVSGSNGALNKQSKLMGKSDQATTLAKLLLEEKNQTITPLPQQTGLYYFYNFQNYSDDELKLFSKSIKFISDIEIYSQNNKHTQLDLASCYALIFIVAPNLSEFDKTIVLINQFEKRF